MTLKEYLDKNRIYDREAGAALEVTRATVNAVKNGKQRASWNLAERILAWTEGQVQIKELPFWKDFG